MRNILTILLLSLVCTHGQVLITPDRLTDWRAGVMTGVTGGRWDRTTYTNLSGSGIDPTGVVAADGYINTAIVNCPSNQAVVLPSGKFKLTLGINLKQDCTLKGQGSGLTTLVLNGDVFLLLRDPTADNNFFLHHTLVNQGTTITSGATLGSSNIVVASTAGFVVGQEVEIGCTNAPNQGNGIVVVKTDGGQFLVNQKAIVTATNATQITFWPPLYSDQSTNGSTVTFGSSSTFRKYMGLESISINATNGSHAFDINVSQNYQSWFYDVTVNGAANYALYLYDSLQCQITHSRFGPTAASGPNHANLLMEHNTATLVEDNIFESSMPGIEVNFGECGSVFGYNFMTNANVAGINFDSNHGPHNQFNLWEGNVVPEIISDSYFGSESCGAIFRNWLTGVEGDQTWPLKLNRFCRNYSVCGNIIGNAGPGNINDVYGQPNIGNGSSSGFAPPWADWGTLAGPTGFQEFDEGVTNSYIKKGNYHVNTGTTDSLAGGTLSNSLYYASAPSWFGGLTFPPVNPVTHAPNMLTIIPASVRYFTGTNQPPTPSKVVHVNKLGVGKAKIGP